MEKHGRFLKDPNQTSKGKTTMSMMKNTLMRLTVYYTC